MTNLTKTSKTNFAKTSLKLVAIMAIIIALVTGCSNADTTTFQSEPTATVSNQYTYDMAILDSARNFSQISGFFENNPFFSGRYFTVTKISDDAYVVNNNGSPINVTITQKEESDPIGEHTDIADVSDKHEQIISNSKNLIYDYVDQSTILQDKTGIKNYIKNISSKEACFTDDNTIGAHFSYKDDTIYINKVNSDAVCEWMIVHELVHALSYYTHGLSIENEPYASAAFNEGLTDIITESMNPQMPSNTMSGYALQDALLKPYIYIVQMQAIKAYFYGYDELYERFGYEEFNFFVQYVFQHYEESESMMAIYNNLILKWFAQSTNNVA